MASKSLRALTLAILALALGAGSAAAAPAWDLSLSGTPSSLPRSDERIDYTVAIANEAPENPQVGDELTCRGTPEDGVGWFGNPTPSFEIEWLRNGTPIPGTKAPAAAPNTYTLTGADEGKSIQCRITATNDPDGAGGTYAPISSARVTQPPVVVEPAPSPAPPSGSGWPQLGGPAAAAGATITCEAPQGWSGVASATPTAGSNELTDVTTAEGSGVSEPGSKVITGVTTRWGAFEVGQTIRIVGTYAGLPAGTTITAIGAGTLELSAAATGEPATVQLFAGAKPFAVGQPVEGTGIPSGTTITAVSGQTLILSANVTKWVSRMALLGPGIGSASWSFQWLRNGHSIDGATGTSYVVQGDDVSPPSTLQCEARAKDAAGNEAISISGNEETRPTPPTPYGFPGLSTTPPPPAVTFSNQSAGPVTLEVDLPSGAETQVVDIYDPTLVKEDPSGWTCDSERAAGAIHAKAICTRADSLAPGKSYPSIGIGVYLGKDAPDVGTAVASLSGGGADPVSAQATYAFDGPGLDFGILEDSFEAGVFDEAGDTFDHAGAHPFRGYTTFGFNTHQGVNGRAFPIDNIKDVVVDLPRGFQGNALATPELCASIEEVILATCPAQSAVGGIDIYFTVGEAQKESLYPNHLGFPAGNIPIYSIEPEFGQPAQFAFAVRPGPADTETPYTFVPELRPEEGYAISFRTAPILTKPALYGTNVDLCDFGAELKVEEGPNQEEPQAKFKRCYAANEAGAYPNPLITNPTRCSGPPPTTVLKVNSWQHPDEVKTYDFSAPAITDCDQIDFEPESSLAPTSRQADSPTGLEVEITMPTDGLLSPTGVGQANLDTATVTFPKGMSINPAAADGLGACTPTQIQLKTNAEAQCPESSKIGSIEIDTPIIREPLQGSIYVAKQNDNPFKAPLGIYLVFSSKRDGVTIKVAGKLTPDPITGQLVSTFTENVEAPFSRIAMKFNQGPRAPLINPPKCGTYAIHSEFSPWSAVNPANPTPDEIVSQDSRYRVTQGPGGGACPSGDLEPEMKSGLVDPIAGAKSPFTLALSREDGSARLTGLQVTTPKGLTAYLKGIPYCPDAVLAGISGAEETGRPQLANPSCPAASQVGTVLAGAGAGPNPFQTPGRVYLAGPYKGAPVSLAVVTPAVAGPFDLGNVVIRNALRIDPESAQVTAVSDSIPTILHGILLDVRQIRLSLDRPSFTAAPTSCEPMAVSAMVSGEGGTTANLANHFQVGGCEALGFKPKLSMRLFGGTKRGAHPRLKATLKARPGDANIAGASVALPHSEFLDQAHIKTICTRVQFAAKSCPAASVYGKAEAITPLLDSPVAGPVYLRSSSNPLPDLVAALRGPDHQPIEVVLAGRIDSVNGGIRSSFEAVPDQPVSSFTLSMQGGKKGLLVNSRDICKSTSRVTAEFTAQNARRVTLRPKLQNSCKKARKGRKHKHAHRKHKR